MFSVLGSCSGSVLGSRFGFGVRGSWFGIAGSAFVEVRALSNCHPADRIRWGFRGIGSGIRCAARCAWVCTDSPSCVPGRRAMSNKKAVYRLCSVQPHAADGAVALSSEGGERGSGSCGWRVLGAFSPADFARFLVLARSSLMESQNHLRDAVDKGYIAEETRLEHDALAEAALQEVTGLIKYLAVAGSASQRPSRPRTPNRFATRTSDQRHQPRSPEPRRARTRTPNEEPNLNTNREPRSEKSERRLQVHDHKRTEPEGRTEHQELEKRERRFHRLRSLGSLVHGHHR